MNPFDLPVHRHKDRILGALESNPVIVVESPTGSGKTTQIPQILYEAGYAGDKIIGVTQPRRIAAVSVCEFIARQLGKEIPETVGYKMRFEDRTDASTRIKIMTDGILLQELKGDRYLSRYRVLMVDEAHERSLTIDFILGLLKEILEARPDFRVIVSSATINAEAFSEYFEECPIVKIDAETYPVQLIYDPPEVENKLDSVLEKIGRVVLKSHDQDPAGDILVFLPGEAAIKNCMQLLRTLPIAGSLELLPLYAHLSTQEQEKVFETYPGRTKVIVATNIAETSVTIDGIACVIDSGLAKLNSYHPRSFTSSLVEVPISKASCNQRRGRAGRTRPGVCHRLYSRKDYEMRPLFTTEEIHRTDLSEVVLRMAELGIRDFEEFNFLSPPSRDGILSAVETLKWLDALDEDRGLTEIGARMLAFPLPPRLARMIVEAIQRYPQVIEETLIAAGFLSTHTPFLLPAGEEMEARRAHHRFRDPLGDFVSYLKIFDAYVSSRDRESFCERSYLEPKSMAEILAIKLQLEEIVSAMGVPISSGGSAADYLCAAARGLIQFVCIQSGRGLYRTLTADRIEIHPGSVLFRENPHFIMAGEIIRTTRMYARTVSQLQKEWLSRISPQLYRSLMKGKGRGEPEAAPRDFTRQIKIGTETFQIVPGKGKRKTAILPWERIRPVMEKMEVGLLPDFKGIRGRVIYQGCELFGGERLSTILRLIPRLEPRPEILKHLRSEPVHPREDPQAFCDRLRQVLKLCRMKKNGRKLGFAALTAEQGGTYRLLAFRGFSTALQESLASLERLADESAENLEPRATVLVNERYRALSALLEED